MKYEVLMPFLVVLQPYAATLIGIGIAFKIFSLVWKANTQEQTQAVSVKAMAWATMPGFAWFSFIYLALPFPGMRVTGATDGLHNVSSFIWTIDRIETGLDELLVTLIGKDLSVRAYSDEFQEPFVQGEVPVVLPPQSEDLLYYFVAQRGRFMMTMVEANLNAFEIFKVERKGGVGQTAARVLSGGVSDLLRALVDFPDKIFSSLGSILIAGVLNALMLVFGMFILGIASLIKYVVVLYTLIIVFAFPFLDPFCHGFWRKVGKQYLVLFLWKPLIVLLVWFSFLIIEVVNIDAMIKANQVIDNQETVTLIQSSIMKPGALYTPVGGELFKESRTLFQRKLDMESFYFESTLVSFGILVLLFFMVISVPLLLSRFVGEAPFASNFISGMTGYAIAMGLAAKNLIGGGKGGGQSGGNAVQGTNAQILKRADSKGGEDA